MNDEQPTHLDLFSGIGGFAIAAAWAGFRTIGFSEIEPYACKILKQHWPDVPNFGDIRNVRGIKCDLITGGFPCQPFSCAGKRGGKEDDRYLWPEMLRVIEECNPAWVLAENVVGFASMVEWNRMLKVDSEGNAIGEVGTVVDRVGRFVCCEALDALVAIRYEVQVFIVPACAVDAKHRRDRIWIVAHSERSDGRTRRNGCECSQGERANYKTQRSSQDSEHVANAKCGGIQVGRGVETSGRIGTKLRGISGHVKEGMHQQTQPILANITSSGLCRWQPEPDVGRVAHGVPNRSHRLKALGNAILPQVAYQILKLMR